MMSPQYTDEMADATEEFEYMTEETQTISKEQALLTWLCSFPQVSNAVDQNTLTLDEWVHDDTIKQ